MFVLVDSFDLATLAALRYARSLRPTTLRAVHFVIDSTRAEMLREQWLRADRGVVLDFIDVPDRRLVRAAAELVSEEAADPGTHVTVILPRRSFSPLLGRLLHDRTADKIAGAVSRIPRSAATIIPFDVSQPGGGAAGAAGRGGREDRPRRRRRTPVPTRTARTGQQDAGTAGRRPGTPGSRAPGSRGTASRHGPGAAGSAARVPHATAKDRKDRKDRKDKDGLAAADMADYGRPAPPPGVTPIGTLNKPGRATVEGRVRSVEIRPVEHNSVLAYEIADSTGELTALFYGRSRIPGVICGSRVRFRGSVGIRADRPFMVNPTYELLASGPPSRGTAGVPGTAARMPDRCGR